MLILKIMKAPCENLGLFYYLKPKKILHVHAFQNRTF